MQQSRDQSATFTLAFSSLSSHTHQSPSYTLPTVVCAVVTWIKGFSGHAVPVLSRSPADNRHLTSCLSSPLHSPDPGDPGNQRERPPDGRHADGEGRQRQLGGGLQSPDHHAPPHGAWQRGGSWHNVYTHTHTHYTLITYWCSWLLSESGQKQSEEVSEYLNSIDHGT